MEEIKERLNAVAQTVIDLRAGTYPYSHFIGAEFCFLQLRLVYEEIALGCVVMHEKMGVLREVWQADELMRRLSKFHADFYPKPMNERVEGDTLHVWPISEPYLTKDQLIDAYGKAGDKLHRGRSGDILFKRVKVYDLDEVVEQMNLTISLLSQHYIMVAQDGHFVRVKLEDPGDGKVKVNAWLPTARE